MRMTLQEIMDCNAWDTYCKLHGCSGWAINEGYGNSAVDLTLDQAHHLGIVKMTNWKVKPFNEVYPQEDKL